MVSDFLRVHGCDTRLDLVLEELINLEHYSDVIIGAMTARITSLTIVYSTVYSGADQRKYQSSASLAFVRVTHRFYIKKPRKMLPFDDVIVE